MTAVLFATIVWQVVDFIKEVLNYKTNASAVRTQAAAWIGCILLVWLASHAQVTADIVPPGFEHTFAGLDFGSVVLVGFAYASLGSSAVDITKAIDNTDTATKPPMAVPKF